MSKTSLLAPAFLALLAASGPAMACDAASSLAERFVAPTLARPMIVAHRGCHDWAPENSIAAVRECIHMGVEAIEIDVRLTADGEVVLAHDSTLARTTDGYGYIYEKTLDELRAYHLRERQGGADALVTAYSIPTLGEVLDAARDDVLINLEIKTDSLHAFNDVFDASVAVAREHDALDTIFFKIPDNVVGRDRSGEAKPRLQSLNLTDVQLVMPIIWYSDLAFRSRLDEFDGYAATGYEVVLDDEQPWLDGRDDPRLEGKRIMMVAVQPRWSAGHSDEVSLFDPDAGWGRLIDLGADVVMTGQPRALQLYLDSRFGRAETCEAEGEGGVDER